MILFVIYTSVGNNPQRSWVHPLRKNVFVPVLDDSIRPGDLPTGSLNRRNGAGVYLVGALAEQELVCHYCAPKPMN